MTFSFLDCAYVVCSFLEIKFFSPNTLFHQMPTVPKSRVSLEKTKRLATSVETVEGRPERVEQEGVEPEKSRVVEYVSVWGWVWERYC